MRKKAKNTKDNLFYEVFVKLVNHGKEIGKTYLQLKAISPLNAAIKAEEIIENQYGENIISQAVKVSPISEDEFLYLQAA